MALTAEERKANVARVKGLIRDLDRERTTLIDQARQHLKSAERMRSMENELRRVFNVEQREDRSALEDLALGSHDAPTLTGAQREAEEEELRTVLAGLVDDPRIPAAERKAKLAVALAIVEKWKGGEADADA